MKFYRTTLLLTLLLFVQALTAQPAWIRDSLDFYITRSMKTEKVPGLAIAVIQDGKVVLQRSYGVLEDGSAEAVDANTLFMIGSNSKAYTGTAIALLEQEGKLGLDDRVSKWLPKFRLHDACATSMTTLRDLLCHRIGMRTFQGDFTFWGSTLSQEEVMEKMAALEPSYDFRSRFGYCNSAFLTAGKVIPAAAGMSWEEMVRERIFKPLKMDRALALSAELPAARNYAKPHALYDQQLQQLPPPTIDNMAPAGSISLSVSDMTHWLLMQMDTGRYGGVQVLPKSVILKTWDMNTVVNPRNSYGYGLGWFISYPDGKKMLDHTGGVDGFLSASAFLPELRLGVIVLTNSDNNSLYASLRDQLLQVYRNQQFSNKIAEATARWQENEKQEAARIAKLRATVAQTKPLSAANQESFTGNYSNPVYGDIKVVRENAFLLVQLSHHPNGTAILEYLGDDNFLCTFGTPTLGIQPMTFNRDAKGKVIGLTLKVNDFIEYGAYEFTKK